jgi:hypothetical protein
VSTKKDIHYKDISLKSGEKKYFLIQNSLSKKLKIIIVLNENLNKKSQINNLYINCKTYKTFTIKI